MTTYIKTSVTWSKASREHILETPAIVSAIATKKDSMIADGKMFDELDLVETDTTIKQINKFSNATAANEWLSFIDSLATSNSLTKISSGIVSVTKP